VSFQVTHNEASIINSIKLKLIDYKQLTKVGLSFSVLISAAFGFFMGMATSYSFLSWLIFLISGFLVTASSNTFNQILEKDTDKLMKRTLNRPLPTGRMTITEALLFAGFSGFIGIVALWYFFNVNCAIVGILSLFTYSFIYTPLKKVSPIAVFVGAFPGAFPVIIGYLAANGGVYNVEVWYLFAIQFIWQFPHFWAIAWMTNDDYQNAGFNLLPTTEGRSTSTAILCLMYIVSLIFIVLYYCITREFFSIITMLSACIGLFFLYYGYMLLKLQNNTSARNLMLASILYLPVIQLLFCIDKFLK
jgi:protoheme IX farnesyltransferase